MNFSSFAVSPHTPNAPSTALRPAPIRRARRRRHFGILALSSALLINVGPSAPGRAAYAATFFCVGDCNLDRTVTIDEILVGVNIALGLRSTHDCPAFDSDGNATVTVDELVTAVRSALDGCDPGGP